MSPTSGIVRLNTIDTVIRSRLGRPRRNRIPATTSIGHLLWHRRSRCRTGRLRRSIPLGRLRNVIHVIHPPGLRMTFLPTGRQFVLQDLVVVVVWTPDVTGGTNDGQGSSTGGTVPRHERYDDLALDRIRIVVGCFAQVEPLVSRILERLDRVGRDTHAAEEARTLTLLNLALVPDRYRDTVILAQVQIVVGVPLGLERRLADVRLVLLGGAIDADFGKRIWQTEKVLPGQITGA